MSARGQEARLQRLLDEMRSHGGRWNTARVHALYRGPGWGAPQTGTARRDLAELHRRGHLTQHGPEDGRYYHLRKEGRR
ncbi:hypothetical protein C9F11_37655 [Streptomyces sp. YIM 121038]|uniref:hypothetical protein n=1 Tax=Streptomyces sp. YIM 121038 TaxID=2136401 RepID=UPI001110AAF4|nr:hypothetical protein [Streptomyces sp. YIM 121038]QCX81114.1 hypothetical protein C9F11_37655 [Streptomyces sp. YIM 121038]